MNQIDLTIHDTVHDFDGSTKRLAEEMGMSPTILNNKACPTNEHHQFQPNQLIKLQQVTGNWSITDVFVAERAKSETHSESSKNTVSSLFDVTVELGRLAEKINDAMSDNVLTERERRECLKEVDAMTGKCEALKAALYREGMVKAV